MADMVAPCLIRLIFNEHLQSYLKTRTARSVSFELPTSCRFWQLQGGSQIAQCVFLECLTPGESFEELTRYSEHEKKSRRDDLRLRSREYTGNPATSQQRTLAKHCLNTVILEPSHVRDEVSCMMEDVPYRHIANG